MKKHEISWDDFQQVDLRVGTIVDVQDFPEARNSSYKSVTSACETPSH